MHCCDFLIKCDFLSAKCALAELSIDIYYNRIDVIIRIYICIKYHFCIAQGSLYSPRSDTCHKYNKTRIKNCTNHIIIYTQATVEGHCHPSPFAWFHLDHWAVCCGGGGEGLCLPLCHWQCVSGEGDY